MQQVKQLKRNINERTNDGPLYKKKKLTGDNGTPVKREVKITDINVASYVEHRSVEIQALTELVKDAGGNHLPFQKLPRHMRRRAMSHNIKRIPNRLRSVAKFELEKVKAPAKRPSRRHRRRPSNLLAEYERRKRRIGWLETHIWHAKRFKMIEKWGYRVALHPNDKSIRACYRAVKRHCMMQDVSYEATIELKGPKQSILDQLQHLTSTETGLTFAAKMMSDGTRQGGSILYAWNRYPHCAIGPVTFLWRGKQYQEEEEGQEGTLWISCHPSIYKNVLDELNKCFSLVSDTPSTDRGVNAVASVSTMGDGTNLLDAESHGTSRVLLTSLKDSLVKFRLFGPASNHVLADTLLMADIVPVGSTEEKDKDAWWKKYYSLDQNKEMFRQQSELWSMIARCQSPAEAPPGCVLALTVRDPRLMLPPKRNKVSVTNASSVTKSLPMDMFTPALSCSPLWDMEVREDVKATKIPEQKLNLMKSKHLIPGTQLKLGDLESRIPIMVIQRPGASSSASSQTNVSHGCGWDLIIPSGFAMAFWVALVYRGARVGGIRECTSVNLQAGLLSAPRDYPDTEVGKQELKAECDERQAKHDRMPPAKRPNFVKLGFPSPFNFDFDGVLNEWHSRKDSEKDDTERKEDVESKSENVVVIRDRKILRLLGSLVTNPKSHLKINSKEKSFVKAKERSLHESVVSVETGKRLMSCDVLHSLVPVRLAILQKGVPAKYGHICLPLDEDLNLLDKEKSYGGPAEPKHRDPGMAARKQERKERLRLRKKRRRGKGKKVEQGQTIAAKEASSVGSKESLLETENVKRIPPAVEVGNTGVVRQTKVSAEGQNSSNVCKSQQGESANIESNSRRTIGYISNGDFDLVTGQGLGVGFCSVAALLHLLENQKDRSKSVVLVRNSTSFQYRFASISILY